MSTAPLAYRWLYSKGTAAALVLSSGLVLAVSQTHVIRDWLATLHPTWSVPWLWVNAAGFELVVLAVGLVLATTGQKSLWVMEAFLILVSCGAALDSALAAGVAVPRAVLGGLMPLQYLAGHRLAGHGEGTRTGQEDTGQDIPVRRAPAHQAGQTLPGVSGQDIRPGQAADQDRTRDRTPPPRGRRPSRPLGHGTGQAGQAGH